MHIMLANARFVCQSLTPSSDFETPLKRTKALLGGLMRTAAKAEKLKPMMMMMMMTRKWRSLGRKLTSKPRQQCKEDYPI